MNRTPSCHNAPRPTQESSYFVQVRDYQPDGTYRMKDERIKYRFSTECKHDGIYSNCDSCQWRKK